MILFALADEFLSMMEFHTYRMIWRCNLNQTNDRIIINNVRGGPSSGLFLRYIVTDYCPFSLLILMR